MVIVGARVHPLRDIYHRLLTMSWPLALGTLSVVYLGINVVFALAYLQLGGVSNADPLSFEDAFFFSIQTLATVERIPSARA